MKTERTRRVRLAIALIGAMLCTQAAARAEERPADRDDAALAYAQCMRENGFAEFPDPSADGRLQMRINPGSAPRFRAAQQACRDLAPPGLAADGVSAEQMEALMSLSRCMRERGVADFPDPDAEGRLNLSGSSLNPESPAVKSAMAACAADRGGMPINIVR